MPTAFKAAYSDWKLVKTRGVVQIVFEVPLAEADSAYELLGGMPIVANERWFGIAAIKQEAPAQPRQDSGSQSPPDGARREKMDWRDMQPAAQAGIRCNEPAFRTFLMEEHSFRPRQDHDSADEAAVFLRGFFGIKSRSELGTDARRRVLWKQMDDQFQAWKALEHA
jgi:hypothetical protein